jgi:hypothetical protein
VSNDVWWGALVSIPIGIATGLAVPWLEKRLASSGKALAQANTQRVYKEYGEALFYRKTPIVFTQHLVQVIVQISLILAAAGGACFLVLLIADLVSYLKNGSLDYVVEPLSRFVEELVVIVSAVLVGNTSLKARRVWWRVRELEKYANTVPSDLRLPNQETEALKNP